MGWMVLTIMIVQADTVRLRPEELLERVLDRAPGVEAAMQEAEAAQARARQVRAWADPQLSVQVDNVGAQRAVTDLDGLRGLEGQAVIGWSLPVGGDRGARIRSGEAEVRGAEARLRLTQGEAGLRAVAAVAGVRRDRENARRAREEVSSLESLAAALSLQAEVGRAAGGDAARARLALSVAREALAKALSELALSEAELALVAGLPTGVIAQIDAPSCAVTPMAQEGADPAPPPEVDWIRAERDRAEASLDLARAERIPDLTPEIGLRRTMGTEALYAGISLDLPIGGQTFRGVDAARAEAAAAGLRAQDRLRALDAERDAAERGWRAVEEAGAHFTAPAWEADLEAVVIAVEARWALGEGTLLELLDGRSARFSALAARARWGAEWSIARARLLRLQGASPQPALFCEPLSRTDS